MNYVERQRSLDFSVVNETMFAWGMMSDFPGLAQTIIDDTTPLLDEEVPDNEREINQQRKELLTILNKKEYQTNHLESDVIANGLTEAITFVGETTVEGDALLRLLQAYRIEKNLAPRRSSVYDPRRIAFRILNPAKFKPHVK